jgi:hypothetical protein
MHPTLGANPFYLEQTLEPSSQEEARRLPVRLVYSHRCARSRSGEKARGMEHQATRLGTRIHLRPSFGRLQIIEAEPEYIDPRWDAVFARTAKYLTMGEAI